MIKKIFIIITILLGLAGTFWGGVQMGFAQGFSIGRFNEAMLKEDMADAAIVLMMIEQIDAGETEKAYAYLNLDWIVMQSLSTTFWNQTQEMMLAVWAGTHLKESRNIGSLIQHHLQVMALRKLISSWIQS